MSLKDNQYVPFLLFPNSMKSVNADRATSVYRSPELCGFLRSLSLSVKELISTVKWFLEEFSTEIDANRFCLASMFSLMLLSPILPFTQMSNMRAHLNGRRRKQRHNVKRCGREIVCRLKVWHKEPIDQNAALVNNFNRRYCCSHIKR